ncbi:MAG: 2-oxo-4-hydroxy-4-carboxy-5-ureidoimidazoline decarboxylase [Xanthomonadales bacterium]|nr:2-oxo-4-hydroxy-4-carboxy-5-ureidoimidazoline decarboxylase [Xanthomonadales bacterium]
MITLGQLNTMPREMFRSALAGIFEHSPWVPDRAWSHRPFADTAALHGAMCEVVASADREEQLALVRAHPQLAGKAAMRRELTSASAAEQSGAGLDQCSAEEFVAITQLNTAYMEKFGFPFILAVRGHTRASIIDTLQIRVDNTAEVEFAEALRQIETIARFRLESTLELNG